MCIRNILKNFCVIIAGTLLQSSQINGAKILGLFPSYSSSHLIIHMSIIKALAEKGHNVTVVSSMQPKVTHPAIKQIIIPPTEEQIRDIKEIMQIAATKGNNLYITMKNNLHSVQVFMTQQFDLLKTERFTKLYEENFDLVIMEDFVNDFQLGVAAKFNCPIIVNYMTDPTPDVHDLVGNPEEVSYVPNIMVVTSAGEVMGFGKRLLNYILTFIFKIVIVLGEYGMNKYYQELFPKENFPTYYDMKKNVSLIFCNSHISEGIIRPNVPAMVEIGGIQIKDKPDDLPKDISEFLGTANQDGAILFAIGSMLKSSEIEPEVIKVIFKTLSSLKQKVIWKWEDLNNLPGKSPNILYKKWLPQDDILAHPNLKLFITHAGKGGIAEAQYHAVPMVALPFVGDQSGNAQKMVFSGFGKSLDMFSMTEKDFKETILEVLNNPKYKNNIQQFSNIYRDRPLTAKQSVVYWTEYVLRHHGAKHMQSPLVHLNYFQKNSFDVIGTLLISAYIIIKLLKVIFRFISYKLFTKRNSQEDSKKVKKH